MLNQAWHIAQAGPDILKRIRSGFHRSIINGDYQASFIGKQTEEDKHSRLIDLLFKVACNGILHGPTGHCEEEKQQDPGAEKLLHTICLILHLAIVTAVTVYI
jgi:hypothetical protein